MNTWRKVGCCLVAAIAAFGAWAEVKWSYVGTTLTQTDAPEGAKPWAFTVNATTGALTKKTVGTGPVLDLRDETMPQGAPKISGTFPSLNGACKTCREVYLPEGITAIANVAFSDWTALERIEIPDGVTVIPQYCFRNCTHLQSVMFSDELSAIEDYAFLSCSALTTFSLPDSLEKIGTQAFNGCAALESVEPLFPDGLTTLGGFAFQNCKLLTGDVVRIGFATNSATGEMEVTTIGDYCLRYVTKLGSLIVGPGVTDMPANALRDTQFRSVEFGCNMPTFPSFDGSNGKEVTNLVIRSTVDVELGATHFNQMKKLKEVTWGGWFTVKPGVTNPFNQWNDLQCRFIVPGNNAKWILYMKDSTQMLPWSRCSEGDKTTYFNRYGVDAKVPEGISIAVSGGLPRTYIVKRDADLNDFPLDVSASYPSAATIALDPEPDPQTGTYAKGTVVTVTLDLAEGFQFAGWTGDVAPGDEMNSTIRVEMDEFKVLVAQVETPFFTYDDAAKTLSDGVTSFGVVKSGDAFTLGDILSHRSDGLLDLSKPIADGAGVITAIPNVTATKFANWLTRVKLPATLKTIADQAFNGCAALESVEPLFPDGLTTLGGFAFQNCKLLTGDVVRIGFATNSATGEMEVTTIGDYCLRYVTKLGSLIVGPGVTGMSANALKETQFKSVEFGCNMPTFPSFDNSNGKEVTNLVFRYTGDIELGSVCFNEMKKLKEVTWGGWFTVKSGVTNPFNLWGNLQCRFIVPRTNDSWNAFMADTTKMTPWASCDKADKDAYFARYGADAVWPAGISVAVSGGLPRTYIVRTLEGANEAQLVVKSTDEEMGSITVDPQPSPETNLYPADTPVVVTLTLRTGATFAGWEGDVAEEDRMKTSITVTMDRSKKLLAKVRVQPEIVEDSFAVAFPRGDSQAKVSFALTGVEGAVYNATAEILVKSGGDWVLWQTLTGLQNGQVVSAWVTPPLEPSSRADIAVCVSAPNAEVRTTGTTESVDVPDEMPEFWGKGGGAGICHVRADATGDGSGRDWFNARRTIPQTVDDLTDGRREIWVATNVVVGAADAYVFSTSLDFRGGFTGVESSAAERPAGLKTVLDGEDAHETFKLTAKGQGATFLFDRIVFTRSSASGLRFVGSGNDVSSGLNIIDCDFIANGANGTVQGRGLYLSCAGDSSISNCTFAGNICRTCSGTSSGEGFGAYLTGNGRVCIDNCQFLTNGYVGVGYSTAFGAAFSTSVKVVTVRNCEFRGNRSGVYADGSIVSIGYTQIGGSAFTNCVFAGNELCETHAHGDRAGLVEMRLANSLQKAQTVDFCNCTFAYNIGGTGAGSSGINAVCGTVHAVNCIFFDNVTKGTATGADLSASGGDGTIKAEYCLFGGTNTTYVKTVGGGTLTLGEGIVTGNPKFVTPQSAFLAETEQVNENTLPQAGAGNNNPHFKEAFSPNLLAFDVHVRPGCRSKAIDAGDPAADWSNEPKPNGKRLNLGAYGNTSEAACSPGGLVLFVQ